MNIENRLKNVLKTNSKINIITTNNAVIYTRVSTREQAENNGSLETQLKSCRQYCLNQKLNVIREFGGTYESASSDLQRKEFQKTLEFVRNKKNEIKFVVVHSYDRFSRTGPEGITILKNLLLEDKIYTVAVTQPVDLSNPGGELLMSMQLIYSKYENELRKMKVIDGMRNKLRNGIYVHKPPYGYEIGKIGGERVSILNEKSKFIKLAFELKATGSSNISVLNRINSLGANLNLKRLGDLFTNPFYCGYIRGSLLGDEIVKGIHEPIITVEIFEQVNNTKIKYVKDCVKDADVFPLKGFLKCAKCNKNWTAYINKVKNKKYYKCNTPGCGCNRNSDLMHQDFETFLTGFNFNSSLVNPLVKILKQTFRDLNASYYIQKQEIESKRSILSNDLKAIKLRFATGKIEEDVYDSSAELISYQIMNLDQENRQVDFYISNPDKFVDFALKTSQNLNKIWHLGSSKIKQSIQKLVFPAGILFDKTKMEYRTNKVSGLFSAIAGLVKIIEDKRKGFSSENPNLSALVVPTRIELVSKV